MEFGVTSLYGLTGRFIEGCPCPRCRMERAEALRQILRGDYQVVIGWEAGRDG